MVKGSDGFPFKYDVHRLEKKKSDSYSHKMIDSAKESK